MGISQKNRVLFYYLSAFSVTGGIEKFNRCFIKALNELTGEKLDASIVSVYDNAFDKRYNERISFKGFNKRKSRSVLYILRQSSQYDLLVLGHINLAIAGVLVKFFRPKCRLMVIAHGIEVWDRLSGIKKMCLKKADTILAVSNYTKNQLVLRNGISPEKIKLFPNTIDPYFSVPLTFEKPGYLRDRYGIKEDQPVIFTLSRLSSSEQYKGYDKVIGAMPAVLKRFPGAVYLLAGRSDADEKLRIETLVSEYGVTTNVILTGFLPDEEVGDHYRLADTFIMPSRKEGFGIVFLEALACGTSAIGGNQDGTVDALLNGSLGALINPTKTSEIAEAIIQQLSGPQHDPEFFQQSVLKHYRFIRYQQRLSSYIEYAD